MGGGGSEWMGKASGHSSLISSSDGGSQGLGTVDPTSIAQAYQSLNIQDDEPVIIPTHLRVPEADRSHLSFGSFGADFRTSSGLAEVQETKKHVETIAADEASIELPAPSRSDLEVAVEMGSVAELSASCFHFCGSPVGVLARSECVVMQRKGCVVCACELIVENGWVSASRPKWRWCSRMGCRRWRLRWRTCARARRRHQWLTKLR